MNRISPRFRFLGLLSGTVASLALLFVAGGCGSSEPTQEDWETAQAVSPNTKLEYKVDSLQSENRRMKEQVNAMAAENRSLTAKNAELETRLTEATANPAAAATTTSADPTAEYAAALAAYRKHDFNTAIQGFESFIRDYPHSPVRAEALFRLGEIHFDNAAYDAAARRFGDVVRMFPDNDLAGEAAYWAGECSFKKGDYDTAIKSYREVLEKFPQSRYADYAMYSVGWSYERKGESARAIDVLPSWEISPAAAVTLVKWPRPSFRKQALGPPIEVTSKSKCPSPFRSAKTAPVEV